MFKPKGPDLHALQVTLICGEDLLAVDANGKSDPFCELQLLDEFDQPVYGKKRTRTKSKTLNPRWDQTLTLKLPKDPKAPRTPLVVGHKVRVQVKDRDAGGIFSSGVVTNLGQCTLSLALLKPGVAQEQWYKLERVGEMQRVEGRIRVKWYYAVWKSHCRHLTRGSLVDVHAGSAKTIPSRPRSPSRKPQLWKRYRKSRSRGPSRRRRRRSREQSEKRS